MPAARLAIREVVETWVVARDPADWETFSGTWHDDGYMMATWFQGPAAVRASTSPAAVRASKRRRWLSEPLPARPR